MSKSEYIINGRRIHVAKQGCEWIGQFRDDPDTLFFAPLKMDALRSAGYLPPHPGRIVISLGGATPAYGPPRTMQDVYLAFLPKVLAGHRPKFREDRPLNKMMIFARDGCRCFHCGKIPERGDDCVVDHLIAVVRGGISIAGNLVCSCFLCNARKGDKPIADEVAARLEVARRNREWGIRDDHLVDMPPRYLANEPPVLDWTLPNELASGELM